MSNRANNRDAPRRGTWLLAGAVWSAACAGLWGTLPVVPALTVLEWPDEVAWLGFGPDARTALVARPYLRARGQVFEYARFDDLLADGVQRKDIAVRWKATVVQIPSGEPIAVLCDTDALLWICGRSRDFRVWVVCARSNDGGPPAYWKLDLSTHTAEVLTFAPYSTTDIGCPVVSPDGELCAITVKADRSQLVLWNLVRNEANTRISGLTHPMAFSNDGRLFAGVESAESRTVRIVDLDTGETHARLSARQVGRFCDIAFNDTGSALVVSSDNAFDGAAYLDVTSGKLIQTCRFRTHPQANRLISCSDRYPFTLQCLNSADGCLRFEKCDCDCPPKFCPQGQHFLITSGPTQARWVQRVRQWLGIQIPFSSRRFEIEIYDGATGRELGSFPADGTSTQPSMQDPVCVYWSADGSQVAVYESLSFPAESRVKEIWHLPPRKSLPWFTAGAALLALPITLVAWRRTRKLRAA
jgi:WD40 repeat protein